MMMFSRSFVSKIWRTKQSFVWPAGRLDMRSLMSQRLGAVVTEPVPPGIKSRPVVLILGWVGAKHKHLEKYTEIFDRSGFSTIAVTMSVTNTFLQPGSKGKQMGQKIVEILSKMDCDKRPVITYAFSQGGGSLFYHMQKILTQVDNPHYNSINIVGNIFDSCPVEPKWSTIPGGQRVITQSISNPIVKVLASAGVWVFLPLSLLVNSSIRNYWSGLMNCAFTCPQLYLYSKADDLVAYQDLETFIKARQSRGVHVVSKCWEDSAHVNHMREHHKEYIKTLVKFVKKDLKGIY